MYFLIGMHCFKWWVYFFDGIDGIIFYCLFRFMEFTSLFKMVDVFHYTVDSYV